MKIRLAIIGLIILLITLNMMGPVNYWYDLYILGAILVLSLIRFGLRAIWFLFIAGIIIWFLLHI